MNDGASYSVLSNFVDEPHGCFLEGGLGCTLASTLPGRMVKNMKISRGLGINRHVIKKEKRKQRHHCQHMPTPVSAKKDLATPQNPTFAAVARLRQRRYRSNNNSAAGITEFPLNRGMRAALADRDGDTPAGVAREAWVRPSGTFKPPPVVHGDVSWTSISKKISMREGDLSTAHCSLCGAPTSKHCWCGASLRAGMNAQEFKKCFAFLRHPSNPLHGFVDPEDQRSLREAMVVCSNQLLPRKLSEQESLRTGTFISLFLSIVACDKNIADIAPALVKRDLSALQKAVSQAPKGELFRGGQRPWSGGRQHLASAVIDWDNQYGEHMAELLLTHKRSRNIATTRKAAAEVVDLVVGQEAIPNFGAYRQKRFLEVLCLAGTCNFGGIALADEHLDGSCSTFPLADNTINGLRAVFPTARTEQLQRQGIVALCRISRHTSRGSVTFARMCTNLCFSERERKGIMQLTKK